MKLYYDAATRLERRRRADQIADTNTAIWPGDGVNGYLKELRE